MEPEKGIKLYLREDLVAGRVDLGRGPGRGEGKIMIGKDQEEKKLCRQLDLYI